jgi:CubicO group peptidase (beta-lactamase class C family)
LNRVIKISFIAFILSLASINPGAIESNIGLADKLIPENVRLLNSFSSGKEFETASSTVTNFLHKWSIAGASVAIARDGKLIFARGFGYTDTSSMTETQPYNLFRIASMSKLVTAIAIMKLNEEGKLALDGKVFGPDGILNDPYYDNPKDKRVYDITVEELLGHESGWSQRYGDQMFMPLVVAEDLGVQLPVDTRTILRFALNKNLHYTPGKGRAYSNLGYSVLGLIVEKISGMPYEDFCKKEILEPLGIYDMRLARNLASEKAPFEVSYYESSNAGPKPSIYGTGELVPPSNGGNDIRSLGGAGAWLSTSPDLMRLLLAVDVFSTRPDMLSNSSINFMTDNSNGYAPVGWKATVLDGTWWRTGSFSGTAGMMKRQPDGISWVVLLNTSAWNGPEIYSYIDRMMTRALTQIDTWPEDDLLGQSLPLPLNYSPNVFFK